MSANQFDNPVEWAQHEALERMYAVARVFGCPMGADISDWLQIRLGLLAVQTTEATKLLEFIIARTDKDGRLTAADVTYVARVMKRIGGRREDAVQDARPSSTEPL